MAVPRDILDALERQGPDQSVRRMQVGQARWKIEIRASMNPETWEELRHMGGRRYRYVDESEAQHAVAVLKKHQDHVDFRISPVPATFRW